MNNSTPSTASAGLPLINKIVLVSGSSQGIGASIARELSSRGANVVINYPFAGEEGKALSVQRSLPGTAKSIIIEADLSTIDGPTNLVEKVITEFGRIDILINNAGVSMLTPLSTTSPEEIAQQFETILHVNGRGTLLLTRAALPYLSKQNSRIINICSSTSHDPDPNMDIYAGSKGMIESFTRCWARDLPRNYGCTVNAIAPGATATENMLASPREFQDMLRLKFESVPVAPRLGEPSEIAWAVAMLCEEGAGWINGVYLPVTGGFTLS